MPYNSYPAIDYERLLGENPFTAKKTEIESLINELRKKIDQNQPKTSTGIDDPDVRNYMDVALGEQRKLLDDYVKSAAGASIKRGGFGVMGAPRLDSSLMYAAIQNLAKDYSSRMKQALEYGANLNNTRNKQYQDDMLNLQKLLNTQKGYLSEEADWKEKLAQAIKDDWEKQIKWMLESQSAKNQAQANQDKYSAEQIKAETELRKLQQQINQKLQEEAAWNRLLKKANLIDSAGRFGAGWTTADDYTLTRLR